MPGARSARGGGSRADTLVASHCGRCAASRAVRAPLHCGSRVGDADVLPPRRRARAAHPALHGRARRTRGRSRCPRRVGPDAAAQPRALVWSAPGGGGGDRRARCGCAGRVRTTRSPTRRRVARCASPRWRRWPVASVSRSTWTEPGRTPGGPTSWCARGLARERPLAAPPPHLRRISVATALDSARDRHLWRRDRRLPRALRAAGQRVRRPRRPTRRRADRRLRHGSLHRGALRRRRSRSRDGATAPLGGARRRDARVARARAGAAITAPATTSSTAMANCPSRSPPRARSRP